MASFPRSSWLVVLGCLLLVSGLAPTPVAASTPGKLVGWGHSYCCWPEIPAGDDFVAIDAGVWHNLALRTDGSIVAWGDNNWGQTDAPTGTGYKAIAAGQFYNLAIKADGSLAGWGGNGHPSNATNIPAGNDYVAVDAGYWHGLALKSDGSLKAWGTNHVGQATVPTGNNYVAIAAGHLFNLALKSDGSIVGWGSNSTGQTNIPAGNDFAAIAAGENTALALRTDGSLISWGLQGFSGNDVVTGPLEVPAGNDFVAIAMGRHMNLALRADGAIVGWGGDPVEIPSGKFSSIAAGFDGIGLAIRTVPEPAAIQLLMLGFAIVASRWRRRAAVLFVTIACSLSAATSQAAIQFGPDFIGSYIANDLGSPSGLPAPAGGLTLLAGDTNTLLIGGNANSGSGAIYSVPLIRDVANHIIGFAGPVTKFANAPHIDGGLAYGPGGVLFYTRFNTHELGQIKPGSTTTDRVDGITGFGKYVPNNNSVGSLAFVPAGFAGAGELKAVTFQGAHFGTIPLSPDGTGTFAPATGTLNAILSGGPEGIAYVEGSNPGFSADSLLVAEYLSGKVGTYAIDASGNPIPSSRRDFITDLIGVEGAFVDPLTGDFLFSTFLAGSKVVVVQGFSAPGAVPEFASATIWFGLMACVAILRRRDATGSAINR